MPGKNSNKVTSSGNTKIDLDEEIQILIEKAVNSWQNDCKEEINR